MAPRYDNVQAARVKVKCALCTAANNEWSTLLQYLYQVNMLDKDAMGRDRVFTFNMYTTKDERNSPKHSKERNRLAKILRQRHTFVWGMLRKSLFMEIEE